MYKEYNYLEVSNICSHRLVCIKQCVPRNRTMWAQAVAHHNTIQGALKSPCPNFQGALLTLYPGLLTLTLMQCQLAPDQSGDCHDHNQRNPHSSFQNIMMAERRTSCLWHQDVRTRNLNLGYCTLCTECAKIVHQQFCNLTIVDSKQLIVDTSFLFISV